MHVLQTHMKLSCVKGHEWSYYATVQEPPMPRKPKATKVTRQQEVPSGTPRIRRVMVPMPDDMHLRLRIFAAERRTTMAEIIRAAIERVLRGN